MQEANRVNSTVPMEHRQVAQHFSHRLSDVLFLALIANTSANDVKQAFSDTSTDNLLSA